MTEVLRVLLLGVLGGAAAELGHRSMGHALDRLERRLNRLERQLEQLATDVAELEQLAADVKLDQLAADVAELRHRAWCPVIAGGGECRECFEPPRWLTRRSPAGTMESPARTREHGSPPGVGTTPAPEEE